MAKSGKLSIVFRPTAAGMEKFWGKLEAELLEIIWANGPMTVKRALYFSNKNRKYAYTTIMTVMNHLEQKGILIREKAGHSFLYTPVMSKDEFLKFAAENIISQLLEDFGKIVSPVMTQMKAKSRRAHTDSPIRGRGEKPNIS